MLTSSGWTAIKLPLTGGENMKAADLNNCTYFTAHRSRRTQRFQRPVPGERDLRQLSWPFLFQPIDKRYDGD